MLKLLVMLTTLFTLTVNTLATILPINGQTTAEISDRFNVFFVPAGYVFSIWGIIYLFMIGYSVYQLKINEAGHSKVRLLFIISNLLNALWIIAWHYNQYLLSVVVMLLLLLTLITIYQRVRKINKLTILKFLTTKTTFSIYLGWISVATIANITAYLDFVSWNQLGLTSEFWVFLIIIIVGLLGVLFYLRERDIVFISVLVWALMGIVVKFPDTSEVLISTGIAVGLMVLSIAAKEFKQIRKR